MDIKSPEERSKNMAAIKSRNTKPEVKLRKALFALGLRYRVNNNLPGKPDIVFSGKRTVIFLDGCFWHGCPDCYRQPDNNKEFWEKKISYNRRRDEQVNKQLKDLGWQIIRIWEHQIRGDIYGECLNIKKILENDHNTI